MQEYRIFNRWGQCIFSTQDLRKGWDGSFNGNPQPPDSYAYQVIAIGYDGREYSKKGVISLIR